MTRWRDGNRLTLLRSGTEYFPALLVAINGASREIFLESYLFEPDHTGEQIMAALMAAAQRGVAVHVLLDGFGASGMAGPPGQALIDAGVHLLFFRPEHSRYTLKRSRLRRLHRKLISIDMVRGFVGGINILDDQDAPDLPPRYDYALAVEGPLAGDIRAAAVHIWKSTAGRQLNIQMARLVHQRSTLPAKVGKARAGLVIRDNLRHRRDIESAYLQAIRGAASEIIIANAYFLPGISLRHAMLSAAKRGVRITLLLQGRIDNWLLHYATRVLYRPLLQAGVEIYEYTAGMMHAKVAVIDQEWLTVGSSNIDPMSLLTAREANIVARHAALARLLRRDIKRHIKRDAQAAAPIVRHTYWWNRILPWLAYMLIRAMLGITGYGRDEYSE